MLLRRCHLLLKKLGRVNTTNGNMPSSTMASLANAVTALTTGTGGGGASNAIVQRADPSAVILPIDMEEATPVSRIEKSEAIKDGDDMSRYLKDVSKPNLFDFPLAAFDAHALLAIECA